MQLTLEKRTTESIDLALIYGVIALLALVVARYLPVLDLLPSCAFRQVVGLPCPTCGVSRSLVYLSGGDLTESFLMNPAVPLVLTAVIGLFLVQAAAFLLGSRISLSLTPGDARLFRIGASAAFLVNWAFLLISGR